MHLNHLIETIKKVFEVHFHNFYELIYEQIYGQLSKQYMSSF